MRRPRIGITASISHPDPERALYKGKALLFFEESMAHFIMRNGGDVVLLPRPVDGVEVADIVAGIDGVLLSGGVDVAPESYGEKPIDERWPGDVIRDRYELDIIREARARAKPLLGVCRGVQILNVALGGTLYQDIQTQRSGALVHRDWDVYDTLQHGLVLEEDSILRQLYGVDQARVNSVHHQGIKDVAPCMAVEARCPEDGVVEALRGIMRGDSWILGVQWHPEFQTERGTPFLDPDILGTAFMDAVRASIESE